MKSNPACRTRSRHRSRSKRQRHLLRDGSSEPIRRLRHEHLESRLLLAGDPPQMLRDVNVQIPGSRPTEIVKVGTQVFVSADDGIHGQELFVSSGANPPSLVKDILPGFNGSNPSQLTNVGGVLYFAADDGESGRELWKSDGTAEGTMLVHDVFPGTSEFGNVHSSSPNSLTAVTTLTGSVLFFVADSPAGVELWKADANGASLVLDINIGMDEFDRPRGADPRDLTVWPQHLDEELNLIPPTLYFSAETQSSGRELWRTVINDGNTTTTLVKNIFADAAGSEPNSSDPSDLVLYKNNIYFAARGGEIDDEGMTTTEGIELWRTDGTEAGTEIFANILPGYSDPEQETPLNSNPQHLTLHNGKLYFAATGPSDGRELWKTDGESEPTMVANIRGGSNSSSPADLTSTDGFLFFTANGGQGKELWRTDGTAIGTQLTRDIRPGTASPFLFTRGYAAIGSSLIFGADDGTLGPEVWISDGSLEGTHVLKEIQFGRNSAVTPDAFSDIDGSVYFEVSNQLWKTDGTESGTRRFPLETVATVGSFQRAFSDLGPPTFAYSDGLLFFASDDGVNGVELWKSDGSSLGTSMVRDIAPGTTITFPGSAIETPNSSHPQELTSVVDKVFFRVDDGSQLMVSDGTEDGTVSLGNVSAEHLTSFAGKLFFAGQTDASGSELWMSDGTQEGTVMVADLAPDAASSYPSQFTKAGGKLFFVADDGGGPELWMTDGTQQGTVQFNIAPTAGSYPSQLTAVDGRIFFRADDQIHGDELWVSNGTPEGTQIVSDLRVEPEINFGSNPIPLAGLNDDLLFFADEGFNGQVLWKTDGTSEGTVVVKDIWPSIDYDYEFQVNENDGTASGLVAVVGGKIFFPADDGTHGTELWSSDGTSAGTTMVRDLFPGEESSRPAELTVNGDKLFFAANQATTTPDEFGFYDFQGRELWSSDGTSAGTSVDAELNTTNINGSEPQSLAAFGGGLHFVANDGIHGLEVWTTSLRLDEDDFLFETLARDIAYRDSLDGTTPIARLDTINLAALGYDSPFVFQVDLVIHDTTTGFDAYGLVAENADPILAIRGSADIDDFFSDLLPEGIGVNQYEENKSALFNWITSVSTPNHPVSITGHSLGGALTQLVAAGYTATGKELGQIVTFNAPAIGQTAADMFNPLLASRVMHYVTNGDPVSLAGEAFLSGEWRRSDFDDILILHNHQYPVLLDFTIVDDPATPEIEKRFRPSDLTFKDYPDTSWLSDPLYFHTDLDYFFWLAAAQIVTDTTAELQAYADIPGRLIFRSTTESERQRVGEAIERWQTEIDAIIDTLTCEATGSQINGPDFDLHLLGILEIQATELGAICVAGSPNKLHLQGRVVLPQLNNATADFSGENHIELSETGFKLFGDLSVDELPIVPGFWTLRDLLVEIEDNSIKAGGTLDIPTGIEVRANVGFLDGNFNSISLEVPPEGSSELLNKPLGTTGIFLQRINGEVDHVSATDTSPVSFGGALTATGGPIVSFTLPDWAGGTYGGRLVDFTVNGLLDKNHLDTTGVLNLANGLATLTGQVELNWNEGFLEADGALVVLGGVINANSQFRADSQLDFHIFADATFGIPDVIPLIGGFNAVGGQFVLDYSNDFSSGNDFVAAWNTFSIPLLGDLNLGFRVYTDGSFGTIGAEEIAEIVASGSLQGEGEPIGNGALFRIESDTAWALLAAQWDSGGSDSTIVLTTPTGETITEADLSGRGDIAIVTDLTSPTRRVVVIQSPDAGDWKIDLADDTGLTNLRFNAFTENAIPAVEIVGLSGGNRGAPVEVTFDSFDVDSGASVSLFYDTDAMGFDGIRIVHELTENDGRQTYTWHPDSLPAGDYFLYAVIDDGINPVQLAYAPTAVPVTPGPQTATVYLPVPGGTYELLADNGEFVVRELGGNELFRAPQEDLLGVDLRGVINVDETLITHFAGITTSIAVDGGRHGFNSLVFGGVGTSLDLTQSADLALTNIDLIDLSTGDNTLSVDAEEILRLASSSGSLRLRHDAADSVQYGDGWTVQKPIFSDGNQYHVLTNGVARIETQNTLAYQNPIAATDVNFSGDTTPLDALQVINYIALFSSSSVHLSDPTSATELPRAYYDVNGSQTATPLDALLVINHIARMLAAEGESPIVATVESRPSQWRSSQRALPLRKQLPQKSLDDSDSETAAWTLGSIIDTKPKNKIGGATMDPSTKQPQSETEIAGPASDPRSILVRHSAMLELLSEMEFADSK